jgi:hypothetical protein
MRSSLSTQTAPRRRDGERDQVSGWDAFSAKGLTTGGSVWRGYCDRLHRDLIAEWCGGRKFRRALKTDLFDEAVGEGCWGALASVAAEVEGIDVSRPLVEKICRERQERPRSGRLGSGSPAWLSEELCRLSVPSTLWAFLRLVSTSRFEVDVLICVPRQGESAPDVSCTDGQEDGCHEPNHGGRRTSNTTPFLLRLFVSRTALGQIDRRTQKSGSPKSIKQI